MTLNLYLYISPDMQRQVADAIESAIRWHVAEPQVS
jgi:hypothetical protein